MRTPLKALMLLLIVFIPFFPYAQQQLLWSEKDISEQEKSILKTYKKYAKRQSSEALKEKFLSNFNDRIRYHHSMIDAIIKEEDEHKDWITWINHLNALEYIYSNTADMLVKNNIALPAFATKTDSVQNAGVTFLYQKANNILASRPDYHSNAKAFRTLSAIQILHPGYKNVPSLIEALKLQGNKGALLVPVQMGNSGNYNMVQFSGVSDLSQHISNSVMNRLSNSIGYMIQNRADLHTAYAINCTWESININEGQATQRTEERSATVKGEKITATVTFTTRNVHLNSSFNVVITDNATGGIIGKKNINAADFTNYVTATYSGNAKALTRSDEDIISKTNRTTGGNFKNEYIWYLYDNSIHNQLCDFINQTLGW